METKQMNSGSVIFPNKYSLAFNPNYVDVSLDSSISYVTISVSGNGKIFSIQCSLYQGNGKCYISRMLQLLFGDDYLNTRVISATIEVSTDTESIQSDTIYVIWGCIRLGDPFGLGEVFNKFKPDETSIKRGNVTFLREVKWFKKFPFSISFFAPLDSGNFMEAVDGRLESKIDREQKVIFETTPSTDAERQIIYSISVEKEAIESTFPFVFDDTFSKLYKYVKEKVKVVVSNETEGYYIRWIDQFGFIQYWLFKKGEITSKNKLGSTSMPIEKNINGVYYGNIERVTSIENTETKKCAAVNLNQNMIHTVETIIKSPYVDLFMGYNQNGTEFWLPINVVAGSYKVKQNKVLQDYEIQFTMPNTASQTL